MNNEKPETHDTNSQPTLMRELGETAATLARLGSTLAALPIAMLPREQRAQAKQLTNDIFRFAGAIPRAVGAMLEEAVEEKPGREDLGSRLRRLEEERARAEQSEAGNADEELEGEASATEAVQEDIQETMEIPPASDSDEQGQR